MPQGLMLLKQLPDENYLHDLQGRGVLRASMNFLPGGCYAGAGLFNATRSYVGTSSDAPMPEAMCPDPSDPVGCQTYEIVDRIRKLSFQRPLEFNAFVFLELEPGSHEEHAARARDLSGADEGYSDNGFGPEYLATGTLLGCGRYNLAVEVLASDHRRMQELVHAVTDHPSVRGYGLGRLRGVDCRGFAEGLDELT